MSTSLAGAKAALVALFEATFADDAESVTVVYGPRSAVTQSRPRVIVVGGVTDGANEADSLEGDEGSFTEDYVIDVVCSVDLPGAGDEGQQLATEAALDLWQRCKAAIRGVPDQDLGAAAFGVQKAAPAVPFSLGERAGDSENPGRTAAVRWGVRVIAQP